MNQTDATPNSVSDYRRIEAAIRYIREHHRARPSLETIARSAGLSPYHFQRVFSRWAGVSPKKFLQHVTLGNAKSLLGRQSTLLDTALDMGLSGTGRLHDLFVTLEAMSPGEFRSGGRSLVIRHSFADSPFGPVFVASTRRGVCHLEFVDAGVDPLGKLTARFPHAEHREQSDDHQESALSIFGRDWSQPESVRIHLKGTPFQMKVWECLLKIPPGNLSTYGNIATEIGNPDASRAVGTAIGSNPIAYLIPCHRVIRGDGQFGGYRWGIDRKAAIIGWDATRKD